MSEITEKILKSGLIDKHTAKMMENFGMLPEGSAEKVGEVAKGQMAKMAEELAEAVEREHRIRETALDLDRLRWHVSVTIKAKGDLIIAKDVAAVIDRMGRYYFRPRDVDAAWFVPGRMIVRCISDHGSAGADKRLRETIVESQPLYSGDHIAAIQVATISADG